MKQTFFLALAAIIVIISFTAKADACSCAASLPPCQAFRDASAVFVGLVTDVSSISVEQEVYAPGKGRESVKYEEKVFHFSIEQIYKGVKELEVKVQTGPALGGDCGYPFKKGERYLVYAQGDSKTGSLHTSICTRTAHASNAGEDLNFLRALPDSASKTWLSGEVSRYTNERDESGYRRIQPLASVKVVISGQNKRYEVFTNEDGLYQIVDLSPGAYKVDADLPGNLSRKTQTVQLAAGNCAQANILTESNGGISGKVIDNEGQAVTGIRLHLIPVDVIDLDNPPQRVMQSHSEETDNQGRYSFQNIPPDRYFLGFNLVYPTRTDYPYPRTYFPGTPNRIHATIITLRDGEQLTGFDLPLPPRIAVRTVEGVLLWSDGSPVAQGHILLKDTADTENNDRIYATADTDEKGRFSIKAFEGTECWLHAWTMGNRKFLNAGPLRIIVNNGLQPVKLIMQREGINPKHESQGKKPYNLSSLVF